MQKRKQFSNYILHENTDSIIYKVYITLREDSRTGDFKALTDKDREDLEINFTDAEIEVVPKLAWEKFIKEKVTFSAFKYLSEENSTKKIKFDELNINVYIKNNKGIVLSK